MTHAQRPTAVLAHLLLQPLWGLCNPVALLGALALVPGTTVSTNTTAWAPLPLAAVGTLLAAAQSAVVLALCWLTLRRRARVAQLAWGVHLAQLPFLPYLLLTSMALSGLEGNIVGFFVAPAFVLYLFVSVPASLAILVLWVLRCRKAPSTVAPASAG